MSLKSLPIVFINLGGEMMYILDQRLKAQNIPADKSDKVLCDIVSTMLSSDFVDELFKPQELYSQTAMKSVFEKLVHSSIMKLNQTSMDKLYDLMTMVFKYQVFMCPTPYDLLYVTLNHLDAIRNYVTSSPVTTYLVDATHSKLIMTYGNLSSGEMQLLRYSVLNFFQDLRIRVSVFLKENIQHPNGIFVVNHGGAVPHGTEIPGKIREFNTEGKVMEETTFNVGIDYELPEPLGSLEPSDTLVFRGTKLGTNIYDSTATKKENEKLVSETPKIEPAEPIQKEELQPVDDRAAKELALLAHLIGCSTSANSQFTLNLFSPDDENVRPKFEESTPKESANIVNIDIIKGQAPEELSKIMSDLNFDDQPSQNNENDVLELMDTAN